MEESKTFLNYRHQSVTANQSNPNFLNFELSTLCRVKISPTDGPKQLLLSLGCGPSLHVVACISSQFDEIFMAETDEGYRRELKSWVDRHAGAFNWDPMLSQVASLKQITDVEKFKDEEIRQKIKTIIRCDVAAEQLLQNACCCNKATAAEYNQMKYSAIITSYCLETGCKTEEQYFKALQKVSNMLLTDGSLILVGMFNAGFECAWAGSIKTADVRAALDSAGFSIVNWDELELSYEDDHIGSVCIVVAKKN